MSYLHNCDQGGVVKRAYHADCVQALGWWAFMKEMVQLLKQPLAAIDKPLDYFPAISQLQASADEAVMQPSTSRLMQHFI